MTENDIIKIVEEAYNNNLYPTTVGSLNEDLPHIGGRPAFFREIKKKIKELLKEYNLAE